MKSKNKVFIKSINSKEIIYDSVIKVDFNIKSNTDRDVVNLRMRVYDPFFNINYTPYYHVISHDKKFDFQTFFISFSLVKDYNFERMNYRGGVRITFEDLDTSEIIKDETFKFNFKIPDFRNARVDNESTTDKRLWIIGDSNVWTTFGGIEVNTLNPIDDYIPVRYTHPSLSLYSFINGDYLGHLDVLPIYEQDILFFYLGEIDLRYSLLKTHFNKKIDLDFLIKKIVFDYFETLKNVSKKYSNNKIFIISPNPPIKDNIVKTEMLQYLLGSENDRLYCYTKFKQYCKNYSELYPNIKFIDWTENYSDQSGFILDSKLYEGDIHIKDHTEVIQFINNYLHINK